MEEQIKTDFLKIIRNSKFSKNNIKLKEDYLNKFIESGFPNKNNENWKFSDISQIIKKKIGDLSFYNDYSLSNEVNSSDFIDGLEHNKIVFINGRIEKIDFGYEDKDKIEILDEVEVKKNFDNINSLINLNNAFANKFYKIIIKKNYIFKKPLIIYHITNNKIKSKNINLRLDFLLEKNSSLKIIDMFNDKSEKNFINIFYNFLKLHFLLNQSYKRYLKNFFQKYR